MLQGKLPARIDGKEACGVRRGPKPNAITPRHSLTSYRMPKIVYPVIFIKERTFDEGSSLLKPSKKRAKLIYNLAESFFSEDTFRPNIYLCVHKCGLLQESALRPRCVYLAGIMSVIPPVASPYLIRE